MTPTPVISMMSFFGRISLLQKLPKGIVVFGSWIGIGTILVFVTAGFIFLLYIYIKSFGRALTATLVKRLGTILDPRL